MVAFQKLQIPASNKALSEWCMHRAVMATVGLLLLSPLCTYSVDCLYLTPVEGKKLVNQSTYLPCCLYAAGRARYMLTWQMHTTAFKCGPQAAPAGNPAWWTSWLAPCQTTPLTASLSVSSAVAKQLDINVILLCQSQGL